MQQKTIESTATNIADNTIISNKIIRNTIENLIYNNFNLKNMRVG